MRCIRHLPAAVLALLSMAPTVAQQEPEVAAAKPVVPSIAVLPFDNLDQGQLAPAKSGDAKPGDAKPGDKGWRLPTDALAEACRLEVEQLLVQRSGDGVRVVERNRLSRALEELELHQSPLVDQDTAVQFGKYVGARYLISGSIQPIAIKEVEVKAYDLDVKNTVAKAEVLLKVLDVETSQIVFSDTFAGSNTVRSSKYRKEEPKDREQLVLPAVKDALKQARQSETLAQFLGKLNPNAAKAGMVALECAPDPEGCDVEVDGLFVGNSPCRIEVPLDKVVTLKLSKPGYTAWEKQLKASKEMAARKIAPTLQRTDKPPEPGEGK